MLDARPAGVNQDHMILGTWKRSGAAGLWSRHRFDLGHTPFFRAFIR